MLDSTLAQGVLLGADPAARALREFVSQLMDFEVVNRYVTEQITAVGVRYDLGEGHDLVGRRMREVELKQGRLYELMRGGRGLLLARSRASRGRAGPSAAPGRMEQASDENRP